MKAKFDKRLLTLPSSQIVMFHKHLLAVRARLRETLKRFSLISKYCFMRGMGTLANISSGPVRSDSVGLASCDIRYINLHHRRDRNRRIRKQFRNLGVEKLNRIEAYSESYGALGCAKSHVQALQTPAPEGKMLMVCEDDLVFSSVRSEVDACIEAFRKDPGVDILCLAFNLGSPPIRVAAELSLTTDTQTTACYLVKERARSLLLATFDDSVERLSAGSPASESAIDVLWKRLQSGALVYGVPNRRLCNQGASFSDVEQRIVDYGV